MDTINSVPFHKRENSANKKGSCRMTVYSVTMSCGERVSRRFSRENAFVQKNLFDNRPKKVFPDDC